MSEAAVKLGVSNHQIRRLIKQGILAADQVVPDAPYQIRASDLYMSASPWRSHEKIVLIGQIPRTKRPSFQTFENEVHNERPLALGRNNWVFFGSNEGGKTGAILRSFTASCQCAGVDPFRWFQDILARIANHPIARIAELLPHNWASGRA